MTTTSTPHTRLAVTHCRAAGKHVDIRGRELVTVFAVGLVLPVVATLPDVVPHVLGMTVPAQVLQVVIAGVGIGVMTGFLSWLGRAHKGRQDQSRDADEVVPLAVPEANGQASVLIDLRFSDKPRLGVAYMSLVRDLVLGIPHYRQPMFHGGIL